MALDTRVLKRRLGGYVLEAQSVARAMGRKTTQADRNFILFGRGRSGSTLLVQMLDANPAIGCLDEVLRFTTLAPVAMVERELGALTKPIRGFKLLSYQVRTLHNARQARALRDWMAAPDVKVFHLYRENVLRHALSNIYARERFAYHSTDNRATKIDRIHVAPDELFKWMRGSLELLEWEKTYLGDLDREQIRYERDLSTPDRQADALDRVSRSLGVDPVPSQVPLRKVTPKDYNAFVENWDSLRDAIAASDFRDYLEMEG